MADLPEWLRNLMVPKGQQGVVPYREGGATPVQPPRTGEYMPREGGVQSAPRVAGLLGSDAIEGERPPATRGGPQGGGPQGRAYGPTQGSTDVVPRNMKQVGPAMKEIFGERVPNPALPAPEGAVANTAKGLAKYLTPVGGILAGYEGLSELNDMFGPGRYSEISAAVENRQAEKDYAEDPEAATRFQERFTRANKNAMTGVQVMVNQAVPKGTPEPAKQAVAQQVESQRQVVEQGAKNQLKSGELNRVDAAWAVVEADIRRSGEKLTPEQTQQRVAEESMAMKKMDNDELSRYLSYALVAGGLIAAAVDKSGAAGEAFGRSFNAQLDREQQKALYREKQKAAAEAAAAEERRFQTKEERLRGDQLINAANVESQIASREDASILGRDKLAAQQAHWNRTAANADAKLAAYRERTKATGENGKPVKGNPLTFKENNELVSTYAKANGLEMAQEVQDSLANQLSLLQKERPGQTTKQYMDFLLKKYKQQQDEDVFTDPETAVSFQ